MYESLEQPNQKKELGINWHDGNQADYYHLGGGMDRDGKHFEAESELFISKDRKYILVMSQDKAKLDEGSGLDIEYEGLLSNAPESVKRTLEYYKNDLVREDIII